MNKLHLLSESGENLETIVKIDKMPEYKVINPTEEEKADAQSDKQSTLPPEVTENPPKDDKKDNPSKGSSQDAVKDLVVKMLDDIKSFLQSI
jgi:hypothetical protein